MNPMFSHSRILAAAALSVGVLAGCNAVEDVRSEPFIETPAATVVLQGSVTGLGSKRSLVLTNNGQFSDAVTVVSPTPENAYVDDTFPVAFNFGTRPVRDENGNPVPYNIQISTQPYGRICSFRAGTVSSGILSADSPPNIAVECVPNPAVARYDLDVFLDPAFASAPGATVRLRTEEAIYEQAVTSADIAAGKMTFVGKLFNGSGPGSPTGSPPFVWTVNATTTIGGTVNRCPMLRPTGTNPTANITLSTAAPRVGACSFTISGAVHYSRPAGVIADPALGSGLTLELRDLNGFRKGTASVPAGAFPADGIPVTFSNTASPATTAFTSNPESDFQVVVTTQPVGQTCIAQDGGYVSLNSLVGLNPTNVTARGFTTGGVEAAGGVAAAANTPVAGTRLVLFCRNKPAVADQLHGIYRLTQTVAQIWTSTGTATTCASSALSSCVTSSRTVTSTWLPYDFTVQNTASSNIISFFDDGTFLYGTHHTTNNVEHGFYDYSATLRADNGTPAAGTAAAQPGRLRFTIHTDGHPNTVFPGGFSIADPIATATPGISALPGALTYTGTVNVPAATRHANLGNVVKTNATGTAPARITGTAGSFGGTAATNSTATFSFTGNIPAPNLTGTQTTASAASQVDWQLTEVSSVTGEMTGGWISQDYRRFWVWDKASTYGFHVGVNGLPNLQSSCFVMENAVSPTGTYQRRSAQTQCFPINRPREGQSYGGTTDARDTAWVGVTHLFSTTASAGAGAGAPTAAQNVFTGQYSTGALFARFPQYESRIPGAQTALDGRSPSPIYYHIAPAGSFFMSAPAEYFPQPAVALDTWCDSDILGIRQTLNNVPFREPVYLCRTRAR
jgi:hypothetical protein